MFGRVGSSYSNYLCGEEVKIVAQDMSRELYNMR